MNRETLITFFWVIISLSIIGCIGVCFGNLNKEFRKFDTLAEQIVEIEPKLKSDFLYFMIDSRIEKEEMDNLMESFYKLHPEKKEKFPIRY